MASMKTDMTADIEKNLEKTRDGRDLSVLDLYSIDPLTHEDLSLIFDLAPLFRAAKTEKLTLCRGKTQINGFFESSTRTMASFDLSGKHLGMDTTNVGGGSSMSKGEGYLDTVMTLDAYNPAVIVMRTRQSGVQEMVARHVNAAIINAGDGWHEHPTQGLLDALTLSEHFGDIDMTGRIITVVGDVMHSRVFGSLVRVLTKLNATIRIVCPQTMKPIGLEKYGCTVFYDLAEGVTGAHAIYALRVQEERGAKGHIPTLREYSKLFGIKPSHLAIAAKDAIVMHPGPVRREVDMAPELAARHPQSRILRQVENGMAVRKAILWLLSTRCDGRQKESVRL